MNTGKRSERLNSNMNRNIAIWIIPVALFTIRHVNENATLITPKAQRRMRN